MQSQSSRSVKSDSQELHSSAEELGSIHSMTMYKSKSTNSMSDLMKPGQKSNHSMAKIFPRLPESVFALDLSKPELMRLSVLYEWLETEIEYIRDMQLLLEFFKDLLLDTNGITEEESVIIFGSIPKLIEASEEIVKDFRIRQAESETFTNIAANIQAYCSVMV
jgi:hypothetical protein